MPNRALAVAAQAMAEACATMDVASQTLLCSAQWRAARRSVGKAVGVSHSTRALADRSLS